MKGGTALNLFHFDPMPRLSVDIDLNYIGQIERDKMLEERKLVEDAIGQILIQNNFERYRSPTQHAGGKNVWRYNSALGQKGNLEIDLNYMFRKTFWPVAQLEPKLRLLNSFKVPVLDLHELAAGKLAALFARKVSRDFFDAHQLLTKCKLNQSKLRDTFVIYACLSSSPINEISIDEIHYDLKDIRNKLLPMLQQEGFSRKKSDIDSWANVLLAELKQALTVILPLRKNEIDFIQFIREKGEINPELITDNSSLIEAIKIHPLVKWRAMNANKG